MFVSNKKKNVSDEWLASPSILQVSNGNHTAKEKATKEMGPFHQSIPAFLNLHVLSLYSLPLSGPWPRRELTLGAALFSSHSWSKNG